MAVGNNTQDDELECMLDNLRFVCTTSRGFNEIKYEYYKEQLLKQYSEKDTKDYELVEAIEPTVYEEQQVITTKSNGLMDSAWPMKCHDSRHTGSSTSSTVDTYTEIWKFSSGDWIDEGPTIDGEGIVYFSGGRYLYALYPNGTLKWKYKLGGIILGSSPAIAEDGTIYIGSWYPYLYAINPNGTLKWLVSSGGSIFSSPAIAEDGTIYFGTMSEGNSIVAVNPNGTKKWSYKTGDSITSDPAIGDDGTIYIGAQDSYLYAMWPNGTLRWRFKTGKLIMGPPSITDDGTIYTGSWDDYLYAIYPNNGTMKWKCYISYGTATNPSIANDGTIYCGSDDLYAINPNGTYKWTFYLDSNENIEGSSPAISADGTIYIGTEIGDAAGGRIIAVNSNGTEKWNKRIANYAVDSSPAIAEDGTVYIGSTYSMSTGYLHAFGPGELTADANGPYYGLTNQPIQFTGSSSGGYSPHTFHWDFGDTYTSEEQNPTHTYTNPGNYTVIFNVTDNKSNTVTDTTYAWIQTTNTAPNKPTINGPTHGAVGTIYDYKFTTTDPDNSIVYLYVDWGYSTNTGWRGPYDNGQQVTLSHSWSEQDTYTIKAKVKDPYEAEGPWATLEVTMPKNKMMMQSPFWYRVLERFPNTIPVLRHLLRL